MIIYGWYEKNFWTNRPKDIECYNCKTTSQGLIVGYVSVFHIFYLPMFPYKIKHQFECTNCKSTLEFNEMDPELKEKYKKYRTKRIPQFWYFSGILLMLSMFIWNRLSDNKEMAVIKSRLENIEQNRILDFKMDKAEYTTIRICEVTATKIKLNYNLYQVNEKNEISKLNDKYNYSQDTIEFERSVLLKWFEEDKIVGVHW